MAYLVLSFLHALGAALLLGGGLAVLAFGVLAHRTRSTATVAAVARMISKVNMALLFGGLAIQPVTGLLLIRTSDFELTEGWVVMAVMLYILAASFAFPGVAAQLRIRRIAGEAEAADRLLPGAYRRFFVLWVGLSAPAMAPLAAVFWLLLARPSIVLW